MENLVVSDSSPLIALLNIKKFELLQKVFSKIIIPPKVMSEIEEGLNSGSEWFAYKQQGFITTQTLEDDPRLLLLELQLDPGESEAILLADQLKLPLLIDEKAGRKIAKDFGLQVRGLVGVLYSLRQRKEISQTEMVAIVDALEQVSFRLSSALKSLLID